MKYLSQQSSRIPGLFMWTLAYLTADDLALCSIGQSKLASTEKGMRWHISHYLLPGNLITALIIILLCYVQPVTVANANDNSQHLLTNKEWQEVMAKVSLLDDAALIPSLLPVIMRNRDALELSQEQLDRFTRWRKENYINMVNLMNEVIEKRIQFRVESLSPSVSDNYLIAYQKEIQRLERKLLKVRLACRDIVMQTFTRQQWETFEFIVADDPKLASLISLRNDISPAQGH